MANKSVVKELAKATGVAQGDVAKVIKAIGGLGRQRSASSKSGVRPFNLRFIKVGRLVVAL